MSTKLADQLSQIPETDCLFVKVKGYTNAKGEVSDYVINAGMSYEDGVNADLEFLDKWTPTKGDVLEFADILTKFDKHHDTKTPKDILEEAKDALIKGLRKETTESKNRSNGQLDAYRRVGPATKEHIATGSVHLKGLLVERVVIKEGPPKKPVNSGAPVRAKNFIKRNYLKTGSIAQFKLDQLTEASVSDCGRGIVIQ
jgi:hypothetical protein